MKSTSNCAAPVVQIASGLARVDVRAASIQIAGTRRLGVWMYTDAPMSGIIEPQVQDPLLGEIVQRLVNACRPERIYLFGSRARGEVTADSDYDIMVVVARSDEPAYRRAQRAHSLLWDLGAAADILVWTREAFDSRVHLRASLPATIAREGRLLYAA